MKRKVLIVLLLITPLIGWADAVEIDGIYYNLITKDKKAEVTKNPNYYKDAIIIPSIVEYNEVKYDVTIIGRNAFDYSNVTSITIPNSVTAIEDYAFRHCNGLTSVTIPNSVTSIGICTFYQCSRLESVTIPNSVTTINQGAFGECTSLTSITLPNSVTSLGSSVFGDCTSLTSITLPNSITTISTQLFRDCKKLTSIIIPDNITSIDTQAFWGSGLTSITLPNRVRNIGSYAFKDCSNLKQVTIGKGINSINTEAFAYCNELVDFYCYSESVPSVSSNAFQNSYPSSITLHVPYSSIEKYKATSPWNEFKEIVAIEGEQQEMPKCETPNISYEKGKLILNCATEGVDFVTEITDTDIKKFYDSEIQLTATYNIIVYALKAEYKNSDVATATLCWIDQQPQTEGITNNIANVKAKAVLLKSYNGIICIQGLSEGTPITIYTLDGKQICSTISNNGETNITTTLRPNDIAVVKMGENSVKIIIK